MSQPENLFRMEVSRRNLKTNAHEQKLQHSIILAPALQTKQEISHPPAYVTIN